LSQVVDDLTFLAVLSGQASRTLLTAAESGDLLTTGSWYYRLHRAVNDPRSSGIFTRIVAALSPERRAELLDLLDDPPPQITIPGPRLVVPIMGALRLDPRPNLLTAEAVAVALISGSSIRVATQSPLLARASATYGIAYTVESPVT
jgi:hypothetical protein